YRHVAAWSADREQPRLCGLGEGFANILGSIVVRVRECLDGVLAKEQARVTELSLAATVSCSRTARSVHPYHREPDSDPGCGVAEKVSHRCRNTVPGADCVSACRRVEGDGCWWAGSDRDGSGATAGRMYCVSAVGRGDRVSTSGG